jgi:hypothetical protein
MSLAIAVDSPPGMISPARSASCDGILIADA